MFDMPSRTARGPASLAWGKGAPVSSAFTPRIVTICPNVIVSHGVAAENHLPVQVNRVLPRIPADNIVDSHLIDNSSASIGLHNEEELGESVLVAGTFTRPLDTLLCTQRLECPVQLMARATFRINEIRRLSRCRYEDARITAHFTQHQADINRTNVCSVAHSLDGDRMVARFTQQI